VSHLFGLNRKIFVGSSLFIATLFLAISARAVPGDGLLIEADLKQSGQEVAGRVLVEAGQVEWATVASKIGTKGEMILKLEARASLVDPDVVEVQTRVNGRDEGSKFLVRLGERGQMTVGPTGEVGAVGEIPTTSLAVKVLRVRYAL